MKKNMQLGGLLFALTFLFILCTTGTTYDIDKAQIDNLILAADKDRYQENYLNALDFYLKATVMLENSKNDSIKLAYTYMQTGLCYDYFDYNLYSKNYINRALNIYTTKNDKKGQAYCLTYMGDIYEDSGDNSKAFEYHNKALQYFLSLKDLKGQAIVYDNLSSVYENYQKFDTSMLMLAKALNLYKNIKDSIGISEVLNNFGDIYFRIKKYKKSLDYYKISLAICRKIGNKEEERGNMKDISKAYAALGDFENSYNYFNAYYNAHRKLKIEKKIEEIAGIEARSIQEKKNLEIQALESEKQILKLQSIIAIVSLVSFFIVLLSIYIAFLIKARKDKQLADFASQKMESELEARKQKLLDFTHMLAERGEIIDDLKIKLENTLETGKITDAARYKAIEQLSNASILTDDDWKKFKKQFEGVYSGFFSKLKEHYPEMSTGDIRLAAILKLKLTQDEIAHMMGISPDSVKKAKSRLKKKISDDENFKLKEWIDLQV